ncbi:MAG: RT0821/Lpp0805 family surface protein [Thiogranum sp.]|jgi:surface antigen
MNNTHRVGALLVSLLLLAVPEAHAFNLRWLKDTPAESFTEEDWQLLQHTVDQALNHSARGDRLTWENPASGNSGSVTNIGPSDRDGRKCIRLGIHNETERLSGNSVASFCRQDDGSWKMEGK